MFRKPKLLANEAFFASTWSLRAVAWLAFALLIAVARPQTANQYGWSRFHGNPASSGATLGANVLPTPLWTTPLGVNINASSPAVGPTGTVFIGVGSTVQAFSGVTGNPSWTFTAAGNIVCTPAVSDGNTVYVGSVNTSSSSGNILYALNGLSGAVLWSYSASGPLYSSPAIGSDGTVFIASFDGYVTALDGGTGAKKWSLSPAGNGTDSFKSSPCLGTDGSIYIGSFNGNLYSISSGGSVNWTYTTNGHIVSSPAFSTFGVDLMGGITGTIVVGSDDNNIYAFQSDGSLMWTAMMGNPVSSSPAIAPNESVVVADEDHHIYSYDLGTGGLKWFFTTGAAVESSVAVGADGTVYVGPDDGNIYAINGSTGAQIFAYAVPGASSSPAINANGTLYVGTGTGVIAFQSVYVDQFGLTPSDVLAGQSALATIDLNQPAPAGGAFVQINFDPKYLSAPNSITVPPGQKTASFLVQAMGINQTTTFGLSVNPGINQTAQLTEEPPKVISVVVDPAVVPELTQSLVTVRLNGPVGPGGAALPLSSSNAAAQVPPNRFDPHPPTIGEYGTVGQFPITTSTVDDVVVAIITASFGGGSDSATLTINPANLVSITLNPSTVAGGVVSVATLTLDNLAGPDGAKVAITSSTASAQAPASVTIPAGATTATFTINTSAVAAVTTANIVANLLNVARSATLTINPVQLSTITLNPATILGGKNVAGTVTLNGPAGVNGLQIFLKSSNSVAVVPNSITVPQGQNSAPFNITTSTTSIVQKAVISGQQGQISASATLTVDPPTPASVSLSPSTVIGGTAVAGTVTLDGPANPGGEVVALTSSDPSASVPTSITIPSGSIAGNFVVTTYGVNVNTVDTITATSSGISASAPLSITATSVSLLSFSPPTVVGGNTATGTITLTGPASPAGTVVNLTSNSSLAQVPATVTVGPGQRSGSFPVQTLGVDSQAFVTITATFNGQVNGKLYVSPASLVGVNLNPSTVAGLSQSTGSAMLNGLAGPSGILVALASDSKNASVPVSVKIQSGSGAGNFPITVKQVTKDASADISASYGGVTQTAVLHLVPLALATLTINPQEVSGGESAVGTITLNGDPPKSGAAVRVSSASAAVTSPGTITIPSGSTTTNFTIKTHGVAVRTIAALSAAYGGVTSKAVLAVDPPVLESVSVAPSPIIGGFVAVGTVSLSGAAPAAGIKVALTSNLAAAVVPASVTVASGKMTASFNVKTSYVSASSSATITATFNGTTVNAMLSIRPTVLESLTLKPNSVAGGKTSTATVTVSGPAPTGGFNITLLSSSSDAAVPTKVVIPAGKTSATFTVKTLKVTSSTSATITATLGETSAQATLTIT